MKGIVLTSHGTFAEGLYDSLKMFAGELEQISCVVFRPDESLPDFTKELKDAIEQVDSGEGVVIFCDLLYGTPCNISASLLRDNVYKDRIEVFAGVNLAAVLEYTNLRDQEIDRSYLIDIGKNHMASINDMIELKP